MKGFLEASTKCGCSPFQLLPAAKLTEQVIELIMCFPHFFGQDLVQDYLEGGRPLVKNPANKFESFPPRFVHLLEWVVFVNNQSEPVK